MIASIADIALQVRPSIVRVVVTPKDGEKTVGTGFVLQEGIIVTCAHVLLAHNNLQAALESLGGTENPQERLQRLFADTISEVDVYDFNGNPLPIDDIRFDGGMDVGVLRTATRSYPVLPIANATLAMGQEIVTCGYPYAIQTEPTDYPYAVTAGMISSEINVQIGGYECRRFFQASIAVLGGASGSPVFSRDGSVVAMINGQMQWGADNHVFMSREGVKETLKTDALYIPLPIAFITPIGVVMEIAKRLTETDPAREDF